MRAIIDEYMPPADLVALAQAARSLPWFGRGLSLRERERLNNPGRREDKLRRRLRRKRELGRAGSF